MRKVLFASMLLIVLVSACGPTPTSVPTPVGAVSSAAQALDEYYQEINAAQSQNDFGKPWDMLTNEEQCNFRYKCDLSYFQNFWGKSKVKYRLYDCGSDRVLAEEMYYPREGDSNSAVTGTKFWKFQLVELEGRWMIDDTSAKQGPLAECSLVIDRSANL